MNISKYLLAAFFAMLLLSIYSCKKEIEDGPSGPAPDGSGGGGGGGGGTSYGDVTFWINFDPGCGYLDVTLSSFGENTITKFKSSTPDCGESGCANFYDIKHGYYYYFVADDDYDCVDDGYLTVDSDCETVLLSF